MTLRSLVLIALMSLSAATAAGPSAAPPQLVPRKVSVHAWFFQGESGMAGAKNRGFMSRYKDLPVFEQANRVNAYGTYLLLEQEALKAEKP
jgi:hypothetical protein